MITLSPALYADLKRSADDTHVSAIRDMLTGPACFGMPVQSSTMFPSIMPCAECNGTGEGSDRTYCPKCDGAGRSRIDGMITSGTFGQQAMILIRGALPKAFQPSYPRGLVSPPAMCKGLS